MPIQNWTMLINDMRFLLAKTKIFSFSNFYFFNAFCPKLFCGKISIAVILQQDQTQQQIQLYSLFCRQKCNREMKFQHQNKILYYPAMQISGQSRSPSHSVTIRSFLVEKAMLLFCCEIACQSKSRFSNKYLAEKCWYLFFSQDILVSR